MERSKMGSTELCPEPRPEFVEGPVKGRSKVCIEGCAGLPRLIALAAPFDTISASPFDYAQDAAPLTQDATSE
jgi:hypothetical protein